MMTETVVNVQDAPNSHAANKSGGPHGLEWIKINMDYFKTLPGLLKLVQLMFGIICMALPSTYFEGGTHWFLLVAAVAFVGTLIWIFLYFVGAREATVNYPINWLYTELINTAIVTLCYFTAFIVQLCIWAPSFYPGRGRNLAAGVFGIFQTLLYGFGTYLLYLETKRS